MTASATGVVATVILCDAAQVAEGKLFIIGGGWAYSWPAEDGAPTPMALAIHLSIPWELANRRLTLDVKLVDEDGQQVVQEDLGDVHARGELVAGRPPQVREGAPLPLPLVLSYPILRLPYGGYLWEVRLDDELLARVPFQVASPTGS